MKKYLLSILGTLFFAGAANAVCPVCTVAVGAGLATLEIWGVDILLAGIWAGAFTMVMVFWTAKWMSKHNFQNALWYLADFILWYGFLAGIYLLPQFKYGAATIWGYDKLMVGIMSGTIVYFVAEKFNAALRRRNHGKSYFAFQKVVVPIVALSILTAAFAVVVY
jgi:hypothetical protein